MNNLDNWNKLARPPTTALKKIEFGYLKGKSDINPVWRLQAVTEVFGQVGHGWTYRIVKTWSETGADGQVMAFAVVAVKTKVAGEWGQEFEGIGGSTICEISKEKIKSNDEGYKMAVTDALSVAFKSLGVAADIYLGLFDGSKYTRPPAVAPTMPADRFGMAVESVQAGDITTAQVEAQPKKTAVTDEIMCKMREALMAGKYTPKELLALPYSFSEKQKNEIEGFKNV